MENISFDRAGEGDNMISDKAELSNLGSRCETNTDTKTQWKSGRQTSEQNCSNKKEAKRISRILLILSYLYNNNINIIGMNVLPFYLLLFNLNIIIIFIFFIYFLLFLLFYHFFLLLFIS